MGSHDQGSQTIRRAEILSDEVKTNRREEFLEGIAWSVMHPRGRTLSVHEIINVVNESVLHIKRLGVVCVSIPLGSIPAYGMPALSGLCDATQAQEWLRLPRPLPVDEIELEIPANVRIIGNIIGSHIKEFRMFWPPV